MNPALGNRPYRRPVFVAPLLLAVALTSVGHVRSAAAQEIFDRKSANEVRNRWLTDLDTVHVKVLALAEAIPEAKYSWRPTPETRSVAGAIMHIASELYYWGPGLVGGKPPADMGPARDMMPKLEKLTAKSEVVEHLKKSWAHFKSEVQNADPGKLTGPMKVFGQDMTFAEAAFMMAGDQHEHLGQLVTYSRSVGVVPPWSRKN